MRLSIDTWRCFCWTIQHVWHAFTYQLRLSDVFLQFSIHTIDSDSKALLFLSELQSYLRAEILDSEGLGLDLGSMATEKDVETSKMQDLATQPNGAVLYS